ncbi:MAG TPA: LD-carboxypeptidase [Bacteroidales bacterium]|nr:LD-carboxypeptidase [Bacteroidales bacterium]
MTSKKIQPPFLKEGDEVAIISPSFCVEEKILTDSVDFLARWGLKVRIGENAFKKYGPFAGTDDDRLTDLQDMTDDNNIKAIFCSRGGYGLSKIINKADFSSLCSSPKWFSGFSDITILHIWLSEVCGVMSVHGEMALNFNNSEKTPDTFTSLRNALFGEPLVHIWTSSIYRPSDVTGEVTGGNLSLLCTLIGTEADPVTKGKILFIEDVGEYYYHIDRMLTSLKLAGKLQNLAALVIGGMNKMSEIKIPWGRSIEETIFDIVSEYDYPVFFDFPAGHISDNRAFYIGKKAGIKISGSTASLSYF